jgi:hypothetical protein
MYNRRHGRPRLLDPATREAEAELAAAKRRTELNAAAKKLQLAKGELSASRLKRPSRQSGGLAVVRSAGASERAGALRRSRPEMVMADQTSVDRLFDGTAQIAGASVLGEYSPRASIRQPALITTTARCESQMDSAKSGTALACRRGEVLVRKQATDSDGLSTSVMNRAATSPSSRRSSSSMRSSGLTPDRQ